MISEFGSAWVWVVGAGVHPGPLGCVDTPVHWCRWFITEYTTWDKKQCPLDHFKRGWMGSWRLRLGSTCLNTKLVPVLLLQGTWVILMLAGPRKVWKGIQSQVSHSKVSKMAPGTHWALPLLFPCVQVSLTVSSRLMSLLTLVLSTFSVPKIKVFFLRHGTSGLTEHLNALSVSYCHSHDLWNVLPTLFGGVLPLSRSQARTLVLCRDRDNPQPGAEGSGLGWIFKHNTWPTESSQQCISLAYFSLFAHLLYLTYSILSSF